MERKSYAVIGLGRFGSRIAAQLYEQGCEVLAIDTQAAIVEQIAEHVTRAVTADAKNKAVLQSLGVQHCDCAVVALGSELAASVLITMNLKSLGVPYIVCKAHDDTHSEILQKLGADRVIIPERELADKLSRSLAAPDVMEYIELSEDVGIVEQKAPAAWHGKTLAELNIRAKYGVTILAIREPESIRVSPGAQDCIGADSALVLLGSYDALKKLNR